MTAQLRTAKQDLKLNKLWIVYPGNRGYALGKEAEVIPLAGIPNIMTRHLR
ncbi:MAG: hypothetical protein AB1486_32385 [Planctomycetota bacterium]